MVEGARYVFAALAPHFPRGLGIYQHAPDGGGHLPRWSGQAGDAILDKPGGGVVGTADDGDAMRPGFKKRKAGALFPGWKDHQVGLAVHLFQRCIIQRSQEFHPAMNAMLYGEVPQGLDQRARANDAIAQRRKALQQTGQGADDQSHALVDVAHPKARHGQEVVSVGTLGIIMYGIDGLGQ